MTKLMDIKGYWNTSNDVDDWNFDEKNIWEGQILLEEDGWFEGLVVDPFSEYKLDRFIFGIFHEGKAIFLNKLTSIEISAPLIFNGTFNGEDYTGEFDSFGLSGNFRAGNTKMMTKEIEQNLEVQEKELETRLENYKGTMSKVFKDIYNTMLSLRTEASEDVLKKYDEQVKGNTIKRERN